SAAPAPMLPSVDAAAEPMAPAALLQPAPMTLPSVESLTFDSDFTVFLQPKVDEALKRRALKKLFSDPAFNVMDGLDTYIDDYSKPDPISPELVRELVQGRGIFGPREAVTPPPEPPMEIATTPATTDGS